MFRTTNKDLSLIQYVTRLDKSDVVSTLTFEQNETCNSMNPQG